MLLQTEHEFTLPRGYVNQEGNTCRRGVMRLATALDEIEAGRHPQAKGNADYMAVILLSRVVTELEGGMRHSRSDRRAVYCGFCLPAEYV